MTLEEAGDIPAIACCSVGIGRWFWVVWASEADARAGEPALASGYEKSADRAAAQAAERLDVDADDLRRLPPKWASAYKGRGAAAARGDDAAAAPRPKSRFSRPTNAPGRSRVVPPRLAFLYCAAGREPPDALGHVTVTRHRIVKQTPSKVHVEVEPFDEDEWSRRVAEGAGEATEAAPRARTVAVDRQALRAEGHASSSRAQGARTFYASAEAAVRDVEAELTAKHAWCATLGVAFPVSVDEVKAAYRRLARTTHPDAGGDPAAFRAVEAAYRAALGYFAAPGEATD